MEEEWTTPSATSTTEADYEAVVELARTLQWVKMIYTNYSFIYLIMFMFIGRRVEGLEQRLSQQDSANRGILEQLMKVQQDFKVSL